MIKFGCITNDIYRFNSVLKQSALPGEIYYNINPVSATKGLNELLQLVGSNDVMVLAHQDMYFRAGWYQQMSEQLEKLPDDWEVAGLIGKDMEGELCGKIRDMRIVKPIVSTHELPHEVCCLDECVLIVKGYFRFDEGLDNFDLYGTLAVLQAWEHGKKAYAIDAPAEHYCMRTFKWFPDKDFERRYKWLYNRFPGKKIDSTVFVREPKTGGLQ